MALMDKVKGILGIPEDADEMYDEENLVEGETEDLTEEGDSAKTSIFGKAVSSDSEFSSDLSSCPAKSKPKYRYCLQNCSESVFEIRC